MKSKTTSFAMCCQKGKVKLPCSDVTAPQIPLFIQNLLTAFDPGTPIKVTQDYNPLH
jgi:hypothetical protein